ncbi:unnamed protein product [Moneuplotes crassus]|uniref:Uncharacterized protein n=1 Tax=Euplotes crassus TaxID=5936 RepID=A0AAD1UEE2_EUPCR|nr:unnamed protein product [Moneuplotes crassus]
MKQGGKEGITEHLELTLKPPNLSPKHEDLNSFIDGFKVIKACSGTRRIRNRYDSIYRSLLRRFRKFYNISFDRLTRYKSLKRYRKNILMKCISEYTATIFPEDKSNELLYSLANLIYPSMLVCNLDHYNEEYPSLTDFVENQKNRGIQVPDILLNFTFTKMELLLLQPGIATLFRHFVEENKHEFSEKESYPVQQMLKICSISLN